MDLERHPELAREPTAAARIAFAFWDACNCSPLADVGDLEAITEKVNGPAKLGLAERRDANFVPQISGRADVDRIVRFAVLVVAISVISLNALAQGLLTLAASSSLRAVSTTVELLVPEGWMIEQRHDADFNRDGRADVLLLLRQPNGDGAVPPRMLLVALATENSAAICYQLLMRGSCHTNPPARSKIPWPTGK